MDRLDRLREAERQARAAFPEPMTAADLNVACLVLTDGRRVEGHWTGRLFAEVLRLRAVISAFGAGAFDLESAWPVYAEGLRIVEDEFAGVEEGATR